MNISSPVPEREQVSTASKMPGSSFTGLPLQDSSLAGGDFVDNWREYCNKQRELFDAERELWAVERKLLGSQISQLQNDLMIVNSKLKQLELSSGQNNVNDPSTAQPVALDASPVATRPALVKSEDGSNTSASKIQFANKTFNETHPTPGYFDKATDESSENGVRIILPDIRENEAGASSEDDSMAT